MTTIKFFPKLYKYTQKGQVQEWQIIAEADRFWTAEGIEGGVLTTSKPTFCKPKNVGKKNETSPEQQALAEAQAKWQKKVDSGYNEVLTAEKKFFEPMLAHKYEDVKINWGKDKVFVQPKLDGLRAVNQNNTLMSRNGKPYLACPHLYQDRYILDGELYNHDLHDDFNKIVSLCKKQKPTEEELAESKEKVEFWTYDFPEVKGGFSKRFQALKDAVKFLDNPAIRIVPTHEVKSEQDLEGYQLMFLAKGYEGTIVRVDGMEYENKRSKSLLKYKKFIDEEFKIVGAGEGEGGRAGTIGYFILEHDKVPNKTFKSNVKGDHVYLAEVWKDHKKYIGTLATVKYFERTPDDVPRFPYIIKLNRAEYE